MITKSEHIHELAKALAAAQARIKPAPKDNVAKVDTKSGPGFSYHYSTLADVWDACRLPLAENGLSVIQFPAADGSKVTISTLLAHTSGQWVSDDLTLVARDASPQAIGSCITYGRRYALGSMVGVVSEEDDDAQAAQPQRAPYRPPPPAKLNGSGEIRAEAVPPWKQVIAIAKDYGYDVGKDFLNLRTLAQQAVAGKPGADWTEPDVVAMEAAIAKAMSGAPEEDIKF